METAGVQGVWPFSRYDCSCPKSQWNRGILADSQASHARWLTLIMERPGGAIQPFWEAVETTSHSQASTGRSMEPMLLMASTRMSLLWERVISAIERRGLVTPVEVSLWVIRTALIEGSSARALSTSSGLMALP